MSNIHATGLARIELFYLLAGKMFPHVATVSDPGHSCIAECPVWFSKSYKVQDLKEGCELNMSNEGGEVRL